MDETFNEEDWFSGATEAIEYKKYSHQPLEKMPVWQAALCGFLLLVVLGSVIGLGMEWTRIAQSLITRS